MIKISSRVLVIDGHSLAYRAFYGTPPLITSFGQPSNAIYGFVNMVIKIIKEHQPDYLFVAFDLPAPTFRHKMYPQYKANRKKTPDDFISQVPFLLEFIEAIGAPVVQQEGFEADDVIGTITRLSQEKGYSTEIFTGDMDALQLVDKNVRVLSPKKGSIETMNYDPDQVKAKYSLFPNQIIDMKALQGDSSDNIPGVPGIGAKIAANLLNEYSTLETIYENIEKITSKSIKQKLEQGKDSAVLSKTLSKINKEVPVEISWKEQNINLQNSNEFLQKMELHSIIKRFLDKSSNSEKDYKQHDINSEIILDKESLNKIFQEAKNVGQSAFNLEVFNGDIIGISFSVAGDTAYYLPFKHKGGNIANSENILGPLFDSTEVELKEYVSSYFEDKSIKKTTYDSKQAIRFLYKKGIKVESLESDVMLMDYLLYPDASEHSPAKIIQRHLGDNCYSDKEFAAKFKVKNIVQLDSKDYADQACFKAAALWSLNPKLITLLQEKGMYDIYKKIDFPLIHILGNMEKRGVALDLLFLENMSKELHKQTKILESMVYDIAGQAFNINSPKQLGEILYHKLGIKPLKFSKTGPSTSIDVLEQLAIEHNIARLIIEYRQITKLLNTYIDVFPTLVDKNKRLHTTFHLTVAATGRLSSSDPNLQNIPIRTNIGEKIRKAFVPQNSKKFIVADYSQIELRVLAHISGDIGLQNAFKNGQDIHSSTASTIFNVPVEEVIPAMRRKAKEINFGIAYGMGAFGLSQRLKISNKEAAEYIQLYFEKFPKIKEYIDKNIAFGAENGYVETVLQRKRFFPGYEYANKRDQSGMNRMIINTPIQGTAADIIKLAMIELEEKLIPYQSKMILQIHDELIVEAPEKELEEVKLILQKTMEQSFKLDVPLVVNIGVGDNWLEAK